MESSSGIAPKGAVESSRTSGVARAPIRDLSIAATDSRSGGSIRVRWLASLTELAASERAPFDSPGTPLFDSLAWLENFSATVSSPDRHPAWLHLEDDHGTMLWPLSEVRKPAGPLRVLAIESLSNFYTLRWQPLTTGDIGPHLWQAAVQAIMARRPALVRLSPLAANAPWARQVADSLSQAGCRLRHADAFANWVAHVRGESFGIRRDISFLETTA